MHSKLCGLFDCGYLTFFMKAEMDWSQMKAVHQSIWLDVPGSQIQIRPSAPHGESPQWKFNRADCVIKYHKDSFLSYPMNPHLHCQASWGHWGRTTWRWRRWWPPPYWQSSAHRPAGRHATDERSGWPDCTSGPSLWSSWSPPARGEGKLSCELKCFVDLIFSYQLYGHSTQVSLCSALLDDCLTSTG